MISHHSKATIFYSETTIINIKADLGAGTYGPDLVLTNNCSNPQLNFLNKIIDSTRAIQGVVNRLVSMQGQTNLIECDSYLRRFYRYATGLTSTMICSRAYRSSLKECKSWAINHCSRISHHQRSWLKSSRSRRSSWFCHAGVFGILRAIRESTGHSCETNHVSYLKNTMWDVYDALGDARHMIQTVNGKTVILTKVTDSLHTKVNSLIASLNQVDSNFEQWRISLSKQLNRVLASILRLVEIEDVVKQASVLPTKDVVAYKHLPHFITSEISMRLAPLKSMSLTTKALINGCPLLIQPMVDYEYD